jgi:hypothetical protein
VVKKLHGELARFAHRRLTERFPYLVLDARYEKVRIDSVIQSQAVLIAVGIDWEGRRQVLGVELANRESRSSWRDFLMELKERGLHGVEYVVSDDHDGLKKAIAECLSGAAWQAAMCTSYAMPSITYRGSGMTTAWPSSDSFTTDANSWRRGSISRPGSRSGKADTPSSSAGSRRVSETSLFRSPDFDWK